MTPSSQPASKSKFRRLLCSISQKLHSHEHSNSYGSSCAEKREAIPGSGTLNSASLQGKVALVTGSSKSVGAAIAKALAAQGACVVINYVNDPKPAEEVARQINSASNTGRSASVGASDLSPTTSTDLGKGGGNDQDVANAAPQKQQQAIIVKSDPATLAGGQFLLEETLRAFGRLDILVLNSGLMGNKTLNETDEAFFDAHFTANVKAPLFLVKAAAEVMERPGGRIIFLSTSLTAASTVLPNALCYVASKGAVEQLSRVLAKDLGSRGFTVNTIAPGPVDTALFRAGKPQYVMDAIAAQTPSHRIAEPDDIGPVVAFVASPAAEFLNGQIIGVNGGYVV